MNVVSTLRFIAGHPLNRGHGARAIGRFIRWQLASRLLPHPLLLPFVDDLVLVVERGMTGATGNYYCGLHEPEDMAFVLHFLRETDHFYDIGANVGSYSLLAAAAGAGGISAFEPSPNTLARLERNLRVNQLDDRVAVHRVALGSEPGEALFTRGGDTVNHVLGKGEASLDADPVEVRTLDEYFVPGVPSLIKIDVEGFEGRVLDGAREALGNPNLLGVLIEGTGTSERYGGGLAVGKVLKGNGFSIFRYEPASRTLLASNQEHPPVGNVLYLRSGDEALARVRGARRFRLVNGTI